MAHTNKLYNYLVGLCHLRLPVLNRQEKYEINNWHKIDTMF